MKRKTVIRVIVISLLLLSSLAGIYFFHMCYGNWWDKPSISDQDISKIIIYEGFTFIVPEQQPLIVLDGQSKEAQQLVNAINSGWYYWQPVKFGHSYNLKIIHNDSRKETVGLGHQIMKISSDHEGESKHYRIYKDISQMIDVIQKRSPSGNGDDLPPWTGQVLMRVQHG